MSKLLFRDKMGNSGKRGFEKGTMKAKTAGQKAAETRKRNKELGITKSEVKRGRKPSGIIRERVTFKALNESNYHKITIESPVDIYIHKSLSRMYISPSITSVQKED